MAGSFDAIMNDDEPYDIEISNHHPAAGALDEHLLKRAIQAALRRGGASTASVSIAIVSDPAIAQLHQEYMDEPGPTDVLTFDLGDGAGAEGGCVEGEVVISADTAARAAASRGHSVQAELALYAVHGILHLLGCDDQDEVSACSMHALEDEILAELGLGPVFARPQTGREPE